MGLCVYLSFRARERLAPDVQVKAVFEKAKISAKQPTLREVEALASNEANRLAAIISGILNKGDDDECAVFEVHIPIYLNDTLTLVATACQVLGPEFQLS